MSVVKYFTMELKRQSVVHYIKYNIFLFTVFNKIKVLCEAETNLHVYEKRKDFYCFQSMY